MKHGFSFTEWFFSIITCLLLTISTAKAECSATARPLLHTEMDWHVYINFAPKTAYDGLELFYNEGSGYAQVFFTRRNGTQVHVSNEKISTRTDEELEFHVGSIDVRHDRSKGVTEFAAKIPGIGEVEAQVRYSQQPSKQHGGLTDPRNHGANSVLPIMYRNQSGLAQSVSVKLDGEPLAVPEEVFGGNFKAPSVYLTENWQNVLLYVFDTQDKDIPDPAMVDFLKADKLEDLNLAPKGCEVQASLSIDAAAKQFSFAYGKLAKITGRVEESQFDGNRIVTLFPEMPDWAKARKVALASCKSGRMRMVIGARADQTGACS